mgnify:CR=1 FL=1
MRSRSSHGGFVDGYAGQRDALVIAMPAGEKAGFFLFLNNDSSATIGNESSS